MIKVKYKKWRVLCATPLALTGAVFAAAGLGLVTAAVWIRGEGEPS